MENFSELLFERVFISIFLMGLFIGTSLFMTWLLSIRIKYFYPKNRKVYVKDIICFMQSENISDKERKKLENLIKGKEKNTPVFLPREYKSFEIKFKSPWQPDLSHRNVISKI